MWNSAAQASGVYTSHRFQDCWHRFSLDVLAKICKLSSLVVDDDMATARAGIPADKKDATTALADATTGLPQLQSLQMAWDRLPKPAKYGVEPNAQPQIELAHAKQAFAQYLTGVHGHPDIHE